MPVTLDDLRSFAVRRTLFPPTTLKRALHRFGFLQADPIRSPARAQDLILRHRVKNYRAGDLERRYSDLEIEEDFFINYGFVTREVQALMHPRTNRCVPAEGSVPFPGGRRKRARLLLDFVRERGEVHPEEARARFSAGKVKNWWGGNSNATTHLLDTMHYQGLLRVVRREAGIRIYAAHQHGPLPTDKEQCRSRLDALVDIAVNIYAPVPLKGLRFLVRRMGMAAPQWQRELAATLKRARQRLAHTEIDGVPWYWPPNESPRADEAESRVRLMAPFDPLVWDRDRFERLWGWTYRFEAYTPAAKRVRGYYALPVLWRDQVIGWANLSVRDGKLHAKLGYIGGEPPQDRIFQPELGLELDRIRIFLGLDA